MDAKLTANLNSFSVFALINNIFDTEYSEKDFVPMPEANFVLGLSYEIN